MSNFNYEILKALKEKFITINEGSEFDSEMASSKREFYLANLKEMVIFCEMKMTEWLLNSPGKLKGAYLV